METKRSSSSAVEGNYTAPTTTTERLFCEVLCGMMGVEQVSVDSHFFDELGADSMVMARFCARLRKQEGLPPVSMKEVYQHPTISSLAASVSYVAPTTPTERLFCETLSDIMSIEQVSVDSHFFDELGADSMVMARFCARLRKQEGLPPVSMKEVYQHPTISSLAASIEHTAPTANPTERLFCEVLGDIMGVEQVSVDSHFFDDLGADSMLMARFCARLRKQEGLPPVSMKEVYEHPTIRSLAAALTDAAPAPEPELVQAPAKVATPATTSQHILCGALQVLSALGYSYIIVLVMIQAYFWVSAATGFMNIYGRLVLMGGVVFIVTSILPILAKWLLIGRWKPQQFPVWSLAYFRFWLVKSLVRMNPLVMFAGSPLYAFYLRALGAKIGRGVVILSPQVPVCTDLLTIGDNTVVRKDSFFSCYSAHDGLIQTGPVTLGKDAFVGETTVLDIGSSLGDGAQLGHSSSLHAGQSVPDGEHRCGSPARQRTEVDYRAVDPAECGPLKKIGYSMYQLLNGLVLSSLLFSVVVILIPMIAERPHFAASESSAFYYWTFYADALVYSSVLFFGAIFFGLVFVATVPRALNLFIKPDKVYPLYGFHYWVHQAITGISNVKFFVELFGDSSYIVYYLRWIGYNLMSVVQTGSNFGSGVKHDNPFLVSIGSGTVIADGLSSVNADYSSTSFRVSRVSIGSNNFLGNTITYPSQGRTGNNCLLATKVMVPVDGEVREGVGLLGSPSFEIPRSVQRDKALDNLMSREEQGRRLAAKNKHNLVTMGLFLLVRWVFSFVMLLFFLGAASFYPTAGALVFTLAAVLTLLFGLVYHALVERASTLFQDLQPQQCSIYDPYFWFHERYWKLWMPPSYLKIFDGTPLKSLVWRLLGVRIGKRVFDDGFAVIERTLATIGDDCTFNAGSSLQPHSQEDGGFKSDYITIGAGCTLGVNALVHYGVTMGDGAQLASDAFLMKGGEAPPHTRWGDNPANQIQNDYYAEAAMVAVTPSSPVATDITTVPGG